MSEAIDDPITRLLLPGIKEFIQWYSPMNHIQDFTCKMMVFHAGDDNNVPLEDAIRFVGALKGDGKTVEFVQVDHGGHYDSMVEQGIPAAIDWLE